MYLSIQYNLLLHCPVSNKQGLTVPALTACHTGIAWALNAGMAWHSGKVMALNAGIARYLGKGCTCGITLLLNPEIACTSEHSASLECWDG